MSDYNCNCSVSVCRNQWTEVDYCKWDSNWIASKQTNGCCRSSLSAFFSLVLSRIYRFHQQQQLENNKLQYCRAKTVRKMWALLVPSQFKRLGGGLGGHFNAWKSWKTGKQTEVKNLWEATWEGFFFSFGVRCAMTCLVYILNWGGKGLPDHPIKVVPP